MDNRPNIILDNGTGYLKCGLSNQNIPKYTLPALVGRPMLRSGESIENFELKPIMIGDEVIPFRSLLELKHPLSEGIIKDKDDMELLWRYAINNKLNVPESDMKEYRTMLTEAPMNPNKNKEIMAEIIFEKMGIGAFNIEPQAKLSLLCEGLESGIVLDSGDGVTHCIPIYDNMILHHNIRRLNIAGRSITDNLIKLLQVRGYAFNSSADFETVREIKEKFCFTSCDLVSDRKLAQETTFYNSYYKLPDGRTIQIGKEKFEAPEILFNPMQIGMEGDGAAELVFKSINTCPMDTRKALYNAIILSGANTMFPGFSSRMKSDVTKLYQENVLKDMTKEVKISIKIIDTPRRKYSVFMGACFLSNFYSTTNPESYWISKEEYEDAGKQIIYKKCQNILY